MRLQPHSFQGLGIPWEGSSFAIYKRLKFSLAERKTLRLKHFKRNIFKSMEHYILYSQG